ncbi:hypothetical protein BURC_00236 [Burkholderiaceae bacterium]|nr:hypothetical protein BURC_00236 [Burkholderiaceae bacterium]
MNLLLIRSGAQRLCAAAMGALLLSNAPALAAPGAHGPNGEHLDGPSTVRTASALPRVEAQSETFELVAEMRPGELAIVVDRYETNEPVLGARLEVESGVLKAVAAFRAEQGDYVVSEAAMLKALAQPGEHGLVFTLVAGKDSDLLDGTMISTRDGGAAAANDHGHDTDHELERAAWVGAGITALALIGGVAWWRQRRRDSATPRGAL